MVADIRWDVKEEMWRLKKAMAEAVDNKTLKRELSKRLRKLLNPLVAEQRAKVLALPSKGHSGQSMRQMVARKTVGATRWAGENTGVSVIQRARGMPRDFQMAGRMFNREEGWNPTTLAGESVTQQMSPSGWFDDTATEKRPEIAHEVRAALEDAAAKIARSV